MLGAIPLLPLTLLFCGGEEGREACKFNFRGSVHRNNILVYKSQQDAQVTEFI